MGLKAVPFSNSPFSLCRYPRDYFLSKFDIFPRMFTPPRYRRSRVPPCIPINSLVRVGNFVLLEIRFFYISVLCMNQPWLIIKSMATDQLNEN